MRIYRTHVLILILMLSMMITGATGIVGEYLLSTISSYIQGNSIEQFSITIALMLLFMGIGGQVQRFISDKRIAIWFVTIQASLAMMIGFGPPLLYYGYGILENHYTLLQYFITCSIGLLIGAEIPLVARLNQPLMRKLGDNIGNVTMADYVGSFIGAMVWLYLLLPYVELVQIGFYAALSNLIAGSMILLSFSDKRYHYLIIVLAIMTALLILGSIKFKDWQPSMEQRLYDDPIVYSETTRYQHLVLTKDPITNGYELFINGNKQFNSLDEHIYHEMLVHPSALISKPEKVLVLGGGDGMVVRELKKHSCVKEIDLVDLDPMMTKLFSSVPELITLNDSSLIDGVNILKSSIESGEMVRLREKKYEVNDTLVIETASVFIMNIDADLYLKKVNKIYDLIIIDLPDPSSPELAKLYSTEFYHKVAEKLSENGVMVTQATSPYHSSKAFSCIIQTFKHAGLSPLIYHVNVPSFGEWGYVMYSKNKDTDTLDFSNIKTRYISDDIWMASRVFPKEWIKVVEPNTLTHPVMLQYYTHDSWKY